MPQGHKIEMKVFKKRLDTMVKEFNDTKNTKIAFACLCGMILLLKKQAKYFEENSIPMYELELG